jgi:predicted site-specific integrase-resolvase
LTEAKRYVPLKRFQELSGLSYATVDHLCKSGQLRYITTESGLRRIDTQPDAGSAATAMISARLDEQAQLLKALCGHLGVEVKNVGFLSNVP